MIDLKDAECPDCQKPATDVQGIGGWLFRCRPCELRWGHPQFMTYDDAQEALHQLRQQKGPTT